MSCPLTVLLSLFHSSCVGHPSSPGMYLHVFGEAFKTDCENDESLEVAETVRRKHC
jgi:hypothetical protein